MSEVRALACRDLQVNNSASKQKHHEYHGYALYNNRRNTNHISIYIHTLLHIRFSNSRHIRQTCWMNIVQQYLRRPADKMIPGLQSFQFIPPLIPPWHLDQIEN